MARSTGPAERDLPAGSVRHAPSGMAYRLGVEGGAPYFEYSNLSGSGLSGRQPLRAFIGSGAVGRSYLFSVDGWWFLAPVSYYSQRLAWDMSPGYEPDPRMHFSRRVTESCLFCHATGARAAAGTYNRYAEPPWEEPGVGCERCHGPGESHVKGRGPIVNPARLDPARRDDVCAQCHLTGEERIDRPGQSVSLYRPGGRLLDHAEYLVVAGAALRATSHVERLLASACKQRSGDRLWCGTCHNPHKPTPPGTRAAFFRSKCLGCHQSPQCRRGPDCVSCHMPKAKVIDAGHSVLTDHSIHRHPSVRKAAPTGELVLFGGGRPSARAIGLAYANLAVRTGDRRHLEKAIPFLRNADTKDAPVLTQLARWEELGGRAGAAVALYEAALRDDPHRIVAAVNLGSIAARQGDLERAIGLWKAVFDRDPATTEAGINLAIAFLKQRRFEDARAVLERVLRFDPSSALAHRLLNQREDP